jgi:hypothetical protein
MIRPEADDIRAAFVRHIDIAPAPHAAAPVPPSHHPSSAGARCGAGASLEHGGVFQRPACVARIVRRDRIKRAAVLFTVALVLAGAAFTVVMALVNAPNNVGR